MSVILCLAWMIAGFVLMFNNGDFDAIIKCFIVSGIFTISVAISTLIKTIKEIKLDITVKERKDVD